MSLRSQGGLRSGKRRLSQPAGPRRKRRKITQPREEREPLYINNAVQSELVKLLGVGWTRAGKIMDERENGLFRSDSDLISRLPFMTAISMLDSPVNVIFDTEFDEECDKISSAISSVKPFNDCPRDILNIIAQLAVGHIESCDNPLCDGEVLISKEHRLRSGLDENDPKHTRTFGFGRNSYIDSLGDIEYFLWFDPLRHVQGTYYHRQNEKYGDATFCADCCKGIEHRYCMIMHNYVHSFVLVNQSDIAKRLFTSSIPMSGR